MNTFEKITLIYLILISVVSVIITLADKIKAIKKQYRIPESVLLLFAALGGSVPMLLTMLIIRHKTKHVKFMAGLPIIIVFQLILVLWLKTKLN